jgi:hypothetical protein
MTTAETRRLRSSVHGALWRLSGLLVGIETPAADPWVIRELPLGLWRVRRQVCRALERLETLA